MAVINYASDFELNERGFNKIQRAIGEGKRRRRLMATFNFSEAVADNLHLNLRN